MCLNPLQRKLWDSCNCSFSTFSSVDFDEGIVVLTGETCVINVSTTHCTYFKKAKQNQKAKPSYCLRLFMSNAGEKDWKKEGERHFEG